MDATERTWWLEERLGVRPGERRDAYAAFAANAGIMAAHVLLETARDAAFLARMQASHLPWMYLAVAAAGVAMTEMQRRSRLRARSTRTVASFLLVAGVVTALFAFFPTSRRMLSLLYVWTALCASWATVQFSLVVAGTFTVEQAKRLFGFIGAGSLLGAIVGSGLARVLSEVMRPGWMMAVSGGLFALTGLGPVRMVRAAPETSEPPAAHRSAMAEASVLVRDVYGRGLLLLIAASSFALTLGDYLFKAQVKASMPAEKLAEFLSTVGLGTNLAGLLVQLLVVPWVLRSFGAHVALLVLPALLVMGSGMMATGAGLAAALVLRGSDGALRYSLHRTGLDILYMPLPDGERRRLKPVLELLGQRGGQCVAALLLLGAAQSRPEAIYGALAVGCLVWGAVALRLRRPYVDLFRLLLQRGGSWGPTMQPRLDMAALESALSALNSPHDEEVKMALDLLATPRQGRLVPALILYHPSAPVLEHALGLFAQLGRKDALHLIDRLLRHPEPSVRAAALRARTALSPDEALLRRCVDDRRCVDLAATALAGLVAQGRMPAAEGQERVARWLADEPEVVIAALARAAVASPGRALIPLLSAATAAVPRAVAESLAEALAANPDSIFLPTLLRMLEQRAPREAARRALVALGPLALQRLDEALGDPSSSHALRTHIPESIRRFPPAQAAPVLLRRLSQEQDGMVRFKLLRSLNRLRRDDPSLPLDAAVIEDLLRHTLGLLYQLIEVRLALVQGLAQQPDHATAAHELLVDMLRDKEAHAFGRAMRLVNLLLPGEDLRPVGLGLASNNPRLRAGALEILEIVAPAPYRAALLAAVRDIADADRLDHAAPFHERRSLSYEQALAELLADSSVTLRTLARYHAIERGLDLIPASELRLSSFARPSLAAGGLLSEIERLPTSHKLRPVPAPT